MRTNDPGMPSDDVAREQMSMWCNYEDGKVMVRAGPGVLRLDPDGARTLANDLEQEFGGTPDGEDPETEAFISDLRERADEIEDAAHK